jgi:membrane protein YdbS with pleckstrin-like domain
MGIIAMPLSLMLAFTIGSTLWAASMIVASTFGALVFLTWWLVAWPPVSYRFVSYRVDADGLEIRAGVYFRSVTTVPKSRVQHTDVSQGPLQRRFGLATLTVHTAGTEHAQVALPGLPHDVALRIRDHLLPGNTADAV